MRDNVPAAPICTTRTCKVLALLLSAALISSVALVSGRTLAYGTDGAQSFDGSTHLDVSSTPGLQLSYFVLEIRFKLAQADAENQFLLSKSSGGSDSVKQDQNYAIFVSSGGRLTGGFQGTDGSYNYVDSGRSVSDGNWHTARLVYDGIRLKLKIDGTVDGSKLVSKEPDANDSGPLRIAGNANSGQQASNMVGEIDHVKILDRSTFKKVYFNDFGGSDPAPTPDPVPDPTPDPTGTGFNCEDTPMNKLRGAVFMDSVLSRRESGGSINMPANYVEDSMRYIKINNLNLVRVPFYWESYVNNPTQFLDELELVAKAANKYNICVIYDNHHWYTSSYWDIEIPGNSDGRGFPSFVVKQFPLRNNDYEDTAGPFWKAFLKNDIEVGGKKVWDLQADYFDKVIGRTNVYNNVIGYEIINEPHLFDPTMYDDLGNYHTYMAKKIREKTDKKIFFNRETTRGFPREPDSEDKIVPFGVPGIVYAPHLYSVPYPGTNAEKQISNFKQWSDQWDVEIFIGEWSADSPEELDVYLKAFKSNGFGWAYYAWKPTDSRGGGNSLYASSDTPPTDALKMLSASLSKIYGIS